MRLGDLKKPRRTEAQRAARRALEERVQDGLRHNVTQVLIDAMLAACPALRQESERHVRAFAQLYVASTLAPRRHASFEGCFSVHSLALEHAFGRGAFKKLNETYGLVEVCGEWDRDSTRAYRWSGEFRDRVRSYIDSFLRRPGQTTPVVRPDGTVQRALRRWSARHNLQRGVSTDLVGQGDLSPLVRVDMDALRWLRDEMSSLQRAGPAELAERMASLDLDPSTHLDYVSNALREVMLAARTDVAGYGFIAHDYIMCETGRLFARGANLQSAPRIVKRFALHGSWQYDFSNCHFSIIQQLAERAGQQCPTVSKYLARKKKIRHELSASVAVPVDSVKACLIALGYGAGLSVRSQDAIAKEIGSDRARAFIQQPFVRALHKELTRVRQVILAQYPPRRGAVWNALGLPCNSEAKAGELQAHILQGIEAQALLAILRRYHDRILLLEHDGFVSSVALDTDEVEAVVSEATGFKLVLEGGIIQLPKVASCALRRSA
jgi:hypothetical protein